MPYEKIPAHPKYRFIFFKSAIKSNRAAKANNRDCYG